MKKPLMTFLVGLMMGAIPGAYFFMDARHQKNENRKLNDKIDMAQTAIMNAKWEIQCDYHYAQKNKEYTGPSVFRNAQGLMGVQILLNNIAVCLGHAVDAGVSPSMARAALDARDEFAASGGRVTTQIDAYGARPKKFDATHEPDYRNLFNKLIPCSYSVENFMDYYDAVWAKRNQKTR